VSDSLESTATKFEAIGHEIGRELVDLIAGLDEESRRIVTERLRQWIAASAKGANP
jgi:hypothetical protein